MTLALTIVALVSLGLVAYVYVGYYLVLWAVARFARQTRLWESAGDTGELPSVSVIVAAYNEEGTIQGRIKDLLAQDYPRERLEVIVCSDGSTDGTVAVARGSGTHGVRALDFHERRGRAAVHNDGVKEAVGDVMVFTDAETRFSPDTLHQLVAPFEDPRVGCTVGHLISRGGEGGVARSEGAYWRYEFRVRELETRLGILATGTGACMAVRRSLFRPLTGAADVDCVTPLDCIVQGYRAVYVPEALAYDTPPATSRAEFRSRVRMTSRNLQATLAHWGPRLGLRHPGVTWGLLSHKLLRWLSPFFLLLALASSLALAFSSQFFAVVVLLQLVGYGLALLGGLMAWASRRMPVASLAFSFVVSNLAIAAGVVQALRGKAPTAYRPLRQAAGSR